MRRSPYDVGRDLRLLLDSHALLWAIYSPERLSARIALLLQDEANELVVSHASLREILSKVGRGKLLLAGTSVEGVKERVDALGVTYLPHRVEPHSAGRQPAAPSQRSVYRILIAQAKAEALPLVTGDAALSAYGAEIVWS